MADAGKKIAKVTVDRGLCIGAASCLSAAPGVFELDGENKAVMKLKGGEKKSDASAKGDLEDEGVTDEALLAAAQSCPTMAILLHDEESNQIYPA